MHHYLYDKSDILIMTLSDIILSKTDGFTMFSM